MGIENLPTSNPQESGGDPSESLEQETTKQETTIKKYIARAQEISAGIWNKASEKARPLVAGAAIALGAGTVGGCGQVRYVIVHDNETGISHTHPTREGYENGYVNGFNDDTPRYRSFDFFNNSVNGYQNGYVNGFNDDMSRGPRYNNVDNGMNSNHPTQGGFNNGYVNGFNDNRPHTQRPNQGGVSGGGGNGGHHKK